MAPSTLALRGPPAGVDLRTADEEMARDVVGGLVDEVVSELTSGDLGRAVEFPLLSAFRNGEGVLPRFDGVPVRDIGGVGRLMEGLSHEEKKSSSGSPAGVEVPSAEPVETTSVTTT